VESRYRDSASWICFRSARSSTNSSSWATSMPTVAERFRHQRRERGPS
jgi:hypothetical protein